MEKGKTIIDLIEELGLMINVAILETVGQWDEELYALGLKNDTRLDYISTLTHGDYEALCDLVLEFMDELDEELLDLARIGHHVSAMEIASQVKMLLGV